MQEDTTRSWLTSTILYILRLLLSLGQCFCRLKPLVVEVGGSKGAQASASPKIGATVGCCSGLEPVHKEGNQVKPDMTLELTGICTSKTGNGLQKCIQPEIQMDV